MGNIAHLRTVQINKHIWLYNNIKGKKTLLTLWEFTFSSFEQTYIPSTQRCFVPSLVEIGQVVLEKKIFKFRQCIFTIS